MPDDRTTGVLCHSTATGGGVPPHNSTNQSNMLEWGVHLASGWEPCSETSLCRVVCTGDSDCAGMYARSIAGPERGDDGWRRQDFQLARPRASAALHIAVWRPDQNFTAEHEPGAIIQLHIRAVRQRLDVRDMGPLGKRTNATLNMQYRIDCVS